MRKTSLTHPLEIAAIPAGAGFGRVGITFCPGKYDRKAMTGYWDRDLDVDLDAIRDWGAAAIVTLLEAKAFADLRVERLGEEVTRRNMAWFHLPIVDGSTPDEQFEQRWESTGVELRSFLRGGGDVLVDCRGGLGRAGSSVGTASASSLCRAVGSNFLARPRPTYADRGHPASGSRL